MRLLSPTDLGCGLDVAETGATFAENARLKAIAYARSYRQWALADDSGLEIDALGGVPGVRSSRFAGPNATDVDRNSRVIELVRGIPDGDRSARYRCAVAIASPKGVIAYETEATVAIRCGVTAALASTRYSSSDPAIRRWRNCPE